MRSLEEAKTFSRFYFEIEPNLAVSCKETATGRLLLSYWQHIFDTMLVLGLELKDPYFLHKVSSIHVSAHQIGCRTINDFIELGKTHKTANSWEIEFQKIMEQTHKDWCKRNLPKDGITVADWNISILRTDTGYLKHILHLRAK